VQDVFYNFIITITDIGDSAVLGALVVTVSACLFAQGCRREALVLMGAFIGASVSIALVKIVLMGCGGQLWQWGLRSPSGHSALSVTVLGTFGLLVRERLHGKYRYMVIGILLLLALIIAMSRVMLGFHTAEEVIAGICVGIIMLAAAHMSLRNKPLGSFNHYAIAYAATAVAFLTHGVHLPAESMIQVVASYFRLYVQCV
jgi:PAP2 superfamily